MSLTPFYADDSVTIYCAETLSVLASLPDASVDHVVTDPPYSSGGQFRGDRTMSTGIKYQNSDSPELDDFTGDNRDQRGHQYWMALWLNECRRVTKPGAICAMFTDWRQLPTATDALQSGGWVWRGISTWGKTGARPVPNRFAASCEFIVWGTNGSTIHRRREECRLRAGTDDARRTVEPRPHDAEAGRGDALGPLVRQTGRRRARSVHGVQVPPFRRRSS